MNKEKVTLEERLGQLKVTAIKLMEAKQKEALKRAQKRQRELMVRLIGQPAKQPVIYSRSVRIKVI